MCIHRRIPQYGRLILALLSLSVILCSCSGKEPPKSGSVGADAGTPKQEASQSLNRAPGGFLADAEVSLDSPLYALSFQPWDTCRYGEEWHYDIYRPFGGRLYQMERYPEVERPAVLITVTDREGEPVHSLELTPADLGALEGSMIVDMDVLGEDSYAFLTAQLESRERAQTSAYELFLTDGEGRVKEHRDMTDFYLEEGGFTLWGQAQCLVDGEGCVYAYSQGRMLVADETGKILMIRELEGGDSFGNPVRDGEGAFYFPIHEENRTTQIVCFDRQTGALQTLARLPEYVPQLYGILGSQIYYQTDEGIVCWDTASGRRDLILSLEENGFVLNSWSYLLLSPGQEPVVLIFDSYESLRITLGKEPPQTGTALQVVSLLGAYDPGLEGAAVASRRNALYDYTWESYEEESDRSRILAQLTAGEGPDILYLSPQDMELLGEKGALVDLRGVISQKTLDALFPVAVGIGTRGENLWGIPDEFYVESLVTTRAIWHGDTWTLSEFLDLADNTPDLVGLESALSGESAFSLFIYLACQDLTHSPFIDWEKGESLFDSEEFIRLLQTLKEKGDVPNPGDPYQYQKWLAEGKILAVHTFFNHLGAHSLMLEQYGGDAFFVGYPTGTGNGNFGKADGVFAVSRNCRDLEAASVYLETLLGESTQSKKEQRVLKSKLAVRRQSWETDADWLNEDQEEKARRENLMKDQAFLENCVPLQNPPKELKDMLLQEVSDYLAGDYPAKEAARIIDSRVQLYLDEHK